MLVNKTRTAYNSDGSTELIYPIGFAYSTPSEVQVRTTDADGLLYPIYNWEFLGAEQIRFTSTPPATFEIYRETDLSRAYGLSRYTVFNSGSVISANDLNGNFELLRAAIEENQNLLQDILFEGGEGAYDNRYILRNGDTGIQDLSFGDSDQIQLFATDGSATFLGPVNLASQSGVHVIGRKSDIVNSKDLISFRSGPTNGNDTNVAIMRTSGTMLFGGTLPSAPNIRLNATDGSASFAGNRVQIESTGNYIATADANGWEPSVNKGGILLSRIGSLNVVTGSTANGGSEVINILRHDSESSGVSQKAAITADGSAKFVNSTTAINKFTYAVQNAGEVNETSQIDTGFIQLITPANVYVNDGEGGNNADENWASFNVINLSGTPTSQIFADGHASFASTVSSDQSGVRQTQLNPVYGLTSYSVDSSASAYLARFTSGGNAAEVASIRADGSATFAQKVTAKGITALNSPFDATIAPIYAVSDTTGLHPLAIFESGYGGQGTIEAARISTDGSATFAGDVKCGSGDINAATGVGVLNYAVGTTRYVKSDTTGEFLSGYTVNTGTPKFKVSADGSADFVSGTAKFTPYTYTTNLNSVGTTAELQAGYAHFRAPTNHNDPDIDDVWTSVLVTDSTNVTNAWIYANGNAKFKGTVEVGSIASNGNAEFAGYVVANNSVGTNLIDINWRRGQTGSVLRAYTGVDGEDDAVINFNNDGSAMFVGDVVVGNKTVTTPYVEIYGAGQIVSRRDNANKDQPVFLGGFNDGAYQSTSQIYGDGRATFAGNVGIGTTSPNAKLSFGDFTPSDGQTVHIYQSGNSRSGLGVVPNVFRIFTDSTSSISLGHVSVNDGSTYTERFHINKDGNATFAGAVTIADGFNPTASDKSGATILASFNTQTASSFSADTAVFQSYYGTSNTFLVKADGTVNAKGSNLNFINIRLEPDNPANYTTTTDSEGNETQVYNGPTLDVKERLLETVNFRTQMRETFQELQVAVEAATDFGELKAAMLVALEDYR